MEALELVEVLVDKGLHERPQQFNAFMHLFAVFDDRAERRLSEQVGYKRAHGWLQQVFRKIDLLRLWGARPVNNIPIDQAEIAQFKPAKDPPPLFRSEFDPVENK
jgi:hypothetical protein